MSEFVVGVVNFCVVVFEGFFFLSFVVVGVAGGFFFGGSEGFDDDEGLADVVVLPFVGDGALRGVGEDEGVDVVDAVA